MASVLSRQGVPQDLSVHLRLRVHFLQTAILVLERLRSLFVKTRAAHPVLSVKLRHGDPALSFLKYLKYIAFRIFRRLHRRTPLLIENPTCQRHYFQGDLPRSALSEAVLTEFEGKKPSLKLRFHVMTTIADCDRATRNMDDLLDGTAIADSF